MKNIDRIDEAFKGKMGTAMQEASRRRIHWVCSQTKGKSVLDVGCSQGSASIILAREGKKVIGIDICQEGIDYANKLLEDEDASTRANVSFLCSDFIVFSSKSDEKYDSIIMSEILEHLADPFRFVRKAFDMLEDDGSLVVTVPFGINDYHDHKRTYYVTELYNTLNAHFSVKDVMFFGSWLGMVATKSDEDSILLDEKLFMETERAFLEHERDLVNDAKILRQKLESFKNQSDNYAQLNIDLATKQKELSCEEEKVGKLSQQNNELLEKVTLSTKELGNSLKQLNSLNSERNRLKAQVSLLQKEIGNYKWKLGLITDKWYGKLAIKFYRTLSKIKHRIRN